jgi:uncharacterized protein YfaS (alpha-2-macroglobulin family)
MNLNAMRKSASLNPRILVISSILAIATLLCLSWYKNAQAEPKFSFPKGGTYDQQWKRVDSLANQGLYKSARELSDVIYSKAKAEKNNAQIIKALIHRFKFNAYIEEKSSEKAIYELRAEIKTAPYPAQPVLHSMLAELYWQYYNNNMWLFQNRSQTQNFANDSIATWDLTRLVDETVKHYELSLKLSDSLKRTPLNNLEPIIVKGSNTQYLRPTLFDFLAHRAIDFYYSNTPSISRPAEQFYVDKPEYYGTPRNFTAVPLQTNDTLAFSFYALKHLQALELFHLTDTNKNALVDVSLKRIHFVHAQSIHPDKDTLYGEALSRLAANYPDASFTGEVLCDLANWHVQRGQKYVAGTDEKYRWGLKRAIEICDAVTAKYPLSQGSDRAANLKKSLRSVSTQLTLHDQVAPNQPTPALLSWKNTDKVFFRIIKLPETPQERYRYESSEDRLKNYLKLSPLQTWKQKLPNAGDLQTHRAEIKIPALPAGQYAVIGSQDSLFNMENNELTYVSYWVSAIGYVHRSLNDGREQYVVYNRESGEALSNIAVQVWIEVYEYNEGGYTLKKDQSPRTDKDGILTLPAVGNYKNYILEFLPKGDHLYSDYGYQYKRYKEENRKTTRTHFFTDRAIYRPGQTVYFKGITIESDRTSNVLMKNRKTTVAFYDVNYQKVSQLELTTNEFGSFNGSFVAPTSGLTGQMRISNESGTVYFSVEEYKRPKFEVQPIPVKGAYRLNDSVEVKGNATMFAGSPVDGAQVKYRIQRTARFPWWWYCYRGYYPTSAAVEIANGTIITNDTGGYVIRFKATADPTVPAESKPIFNYLVTIDVTDITGETHSAVSNIHVGYDALELTVTPPSEWDRQNNDSMNVRLTNLSDQPERENVSLTIHRLKKPSRILHPRTWNKPDMFLYTQQEWEKLFPNAPYKFEDDITKREKDVQVYSETFVTNQNKRFRPADFASWQSGEYVVEATTKDKFGNTIKDVRYFTVYSSTDNAPATHTELSIDLLQKTEKSFTPKSSFEPGETAYIKIGTSHKDALVLYEVELENKIISREWVKLSNNYKTFNIPVTVEHRKGLGVHAVLFKNGKGTNLDLPIYVPRESRQLDVTYETFRNKMLPGSKEEWKIKIKGPKGEKVAAEVLASMYDASLDEFRGHYWSFWLNEASYGITSWRMQTNNDETSVSWWKYPTTYSNVATRTYDYLNWFDYHGYDYHYYYRGGAPDMVYDSAPASEGDMEKEEAIPSKKDKANKPASTTVSGNTTKNIEAAGGARLEDSLAEQKATKDEDNTVARDEGTQEIKARANLKETVFFFPDLETDAEGNVVLKFTMNEALTKWKFMLFAHTQDLKYAQSSREVITQKELMVMPYTPRFFRENDRVIISGKISNMSEGPLSGNAQLILTDAASGASLQQLIITNKNVPFECKKGQSAALNWEVTIPVGTGPVNYKMVASAGNFSDGEENVVPVLSNRMMVTETMPVWVREGQNKTFRMEKLINSGSGSKSLTHHRLTFEFTANPVWYAVQALPYMMEYPYECAEQTFNRFYSNTIASHIANSSPKIQNVFNAWGNSQPDAFLSNLEKNQELKNVILEETPWVLDAQNESERKRRVALLFDLNRMSREQERALRKLQQLQVSNGGWTWFPGMPDDRYMTQYIVTGLGKLDHLGVKSIRDDRNTWSMTANAVQYLDNRIREDYDWIMKHDAANKDKNHLSYIAIQYLYARSFFKDVPLSKHNQIAFDYFFDQGKKYWLNQSRYMQGMLALANHRFNNPTTATSIMKSLNETALHHEELGMYWKDVTAGWYWYQHPIETQSLLIEAFDEVSKDKKSVDEMRVWLLKNKQTNDWKTTKATADACYALLLGGTDWLATESDVTIFIGAQQIDPKATGIKEEAGTGYFKTSWTGSDIDPAMGTVKVAKKGPGISWGAMYWQYFEDIDKITAAQTSLNVSKKLFRVKNTSSGDVIEPVTEQMVLKPGDKIRVRIELKTDRQLEYVHMQDMRAGGFEPVNVLSQYKYQGGLGYYESTRDASTNFFFHYLPKGTHVFEYPLVVAHAGSFSNGITRVQCMYAPEFSAHSAGMRVQIKR